VDPYYAFTWFFSEKWETSLRLFYTFNGENDDTKVKPGQLFHGNYAFSRAITSQWRAGVTGYVIQQTTEDRLNGTKLPGTKERGFSAGPGVAYVGPGLTLFFSAPIEFGVRNRFQGTRTSLELVHRF
jgi:hypothetical protein